MAPGAVAELEETIADIVTTPVAPWTHWARPFWSIVDIWKLELDQVPVKGSMNVTGAGRGWSAKGSCCRELHLTVGKITRIR